MWIFKWLKLVLKPQGSAPLMAANNQNPDTEPQMRLPPFTDSHSEFDRGMERRELTQAQTTIRSFMYGIWGGLPKVDVTFERPRVSLERENIEKKDNEEKAKLTWRTVEREDGGRSFKVKIDWPKEENMEEKQKVSASVLDTFFEHNYWPERVPIRKSDENNQTNNVMKVGSIENDGDSDDDYNNDVLSIFNKRERDILSGREGPTSFFDMLFSKESPFYEKKLGWENMNHYEEIWNTHNTRIELWNNSNGEAKGSFTQTTRKTIVRPDGTKEMIISESVDRITESTHKVWYPDGTYEETADRVEWPAPNINVISEKLLSTGRRIPITSLSNDSPSKISEIKHPATEPSQVYPATEVNSRNEGFASKVSGDKSCTCN